MIKGVIFDYGQVICSFSNNTFLKRISDYTEKDVSELNKLIYEGDNPPSQKYETGLISSDTFYKEIIELCELKISKGDFILAYTDIFIPISTTIDLIKNLKPNYKLGLISNTGEWDFEYAIKKTEGFDLFDAVSLSYVLKVMKPDESMWFDNLNKLGLNPEDCVYIDDIIEYAKKANKLGLHGILYTTHESLLPSLDKVGVDFDTQIH